MQDHSSPIRGAIEKAVGGPPVPLTPTEPDKGPGIVPIPETDVMANLEAMQREFGGKTITQGQLSEWNTEHNAEPRKALAIERPSLLSRAIDIAMGLPLFGTHGSVDSVTKSIKKALHLYGGSIHDPLSAMARPLSMALDPKMMASYGYLTKEGATKRKLINDYMDSEWDAIRSGWDFASFLKGNTNTVNDRLVQLSKDTPNQYFGEKFLSEQFDPSSLVGWQVGSIRGALGSRTMLGSTPFIGKIIEPFDVGYIKATNGVVRMVFSPVGAILRHAPKSSGIKAIQEAEEVKGHANAFFDNDINSQAPARSRLTELMARNPQELEQFGNPFEKTVHHILSGFRTLTPTDLYDAVHHRGLLYELAPYLTKADRTYWYNKAGMVARASDLKLIHELNGILDDFAHNHIPKGQTHDRVVQALGLTHNETNGKEIDRLVDAFIGERVNRKNAFLEGIKRVNPKKAAERIAVEAGERMRLRARYGIEDANHLQGFISGMLDAADPVYQSVWRSGIERWVLHPGTEFVLNFPGYVPGNVMEESLNSIGGGVVAGHMSVQETSSMAAGRLYPDYRLLETRGGSQLTGVDEFADTKKTLGSRFWYEMRRHYIDVSNEATSAIRRHYFNKAYMQEAMVLLDPNSTLMKVIRELPTDIYEYEKLADMAMGEALKGPLANWDYIANTFKTATTDRKLLAAAVLQGPDLMPSSRTIWKKSVEMMDVTPFQLDRVAQQIAENERREWLHRSSYVDDVISSAHEHIKAMTIDNKDSFAAVAHSYQTAIHAVNEYMHTIAAGTEAQVRHLYTIMNETEVDAEARILWGTTNDIIERLVAKIEKMYKESQPILQAKGVALGIADQKIADWLQVRKDYADKWAAAWKNDLEVRADLADQGARAREFREVRHEIWDGPDGGRVKEIGNILDSVMKDALGDAPTMTPSVQTELNKLLDTENIQGRWGQIQSQINNVVESGRQVLNQKFDPQTVMVPGLGGKINKVLGFGPKPKPSLTDDAMEEWLGKMKEASKDYGNPNPTSTAAKSSESVPIKSELPKPVPNTPLTARQEWDEAIRTHKPLTYGQELKLKIRILDEYTPQEMSERMAARQLDKPDSLYRDLVGGSTSGLRRGETWRGRALKLAESDLKNHPIKVIPETPPHIEPPQPVPQPIVANQPEWDGLPHIRKIGDEAWNLATKRFNESFINFTGTDTARYYLKALYPFIGYETFVWEKMAKLGLQHPIFLNDFYPNGGAYWENTDQGYIEIGKTGWAIKPSRFFGYSRIQKAFRHADVPSSKEGVQKTLETWIRNGERGGFYPGLPWQTALDAISGEWNWTEWVPPWLNFLVSQGVSMAAVLGNDGVTEQFVRLPGSFKDYRMRMSILAQGGDPSNPTKEQMRHATAVVSQFQGFESMLSLLRYKPTMIKEQRDLIHAMDSALTGIPIETLEQMRNDGVNIWEVVPQNPAIREFMRTQAPSYYLQGRLNVPLQSREEQKLSNKTFALLDEIDSLREARASKVAESSVLLDGGGITGAEWRRRREDAYTYFSANLTRLQEQAVKDGVPLTREDRQRLRLEKGLRAYAVSEVDEALRATDGMSLDSYRNPYTGEVDWTKYRHEQEAIVGKFSKEAQQAAQWWKWTRKTPAELDFEIGHRKWGYFDLERALDWAASHGMNRQHLEQLKEQAQAEEPRLQQMIQAGMTLQESSRYRSSSSIQFIAKVEQAYRQNLRTTGGAEFNQWLVKYYDTPMLKKYPNAPALDLSKETGERPTGMPKLPVRGK